MVTTGVTPKIVQGPFGKPLKFCGLEDCGRIAYCKGVCKAHYEQARREVAFTDILPPNAGPSPECIFEGCTGKTTSHRQVLCRSHLAQKRRGEELRPMRKRGVGYTDLGRICKVCKIDKPLDEFYDRNQTKPGPTTKSTKCKECYRKDVAYYNGQRATKSDGTDPMGDNPRRLPSGVRMRQATYIGECAGCQKVIPVGKRIVEDEEQRFHLSCYDER